MIFDRFISLPIFLASLAIGLLYVYLSPAGRTEVVVYPTPDNRDEFVFEDSVSNCFDFEQYEVACPSDRSKIKSIPFQK